MWAQPALTTYLAPREVILSRVSTATTLCRADSETTNCFGGAGKDNLTGGGGRDAFVFDTSLNKRTNVDKITDFNVSDRLRLS